MWIRALAVLYFFDKWLFSEWTSIGDLHWIFAEQKAPKVRLHYQPYFRGEPQRMKNIFLLLVLAALILAGCASPSPGTVEPVLTSTQPNTPASGGTGETNPDTPVAMEATATLQPATQTQEPAQPTMTQAPQEIPGWLAYTGNDGNIWMVERISGDRLQVTNDAVPFKPGEPPPENEVSYCCAQWSSDGSLLAYRRDVGTAMESGYQYLIELWVYTPETKESSMLIQGENIPGFSWKPGSHLISYALPIPTEYFLNRSSGLATGIWGVEADSGDTSQLVAPERDYALANPKWSPDGRFMSFEEVFAMEGRGYFAYYDFENQKYTSWEESIGLYDWSPDGETIAYDRLVYTPTGDERIWLRDRQGGDERQLSPETLPGLAFHPLFSPAGDQLAFLDRLGGPETDAVSLYIVDLPDGEPRDLGTFDQVYELSWSPDGSHLALSTGSYESAQVLEVEVSGGTSRVLAEGKQPSWRPQGS